MKKRKLPERCLWRLVRLLYRWRYGVRGGIKPPLNWHRARYCPIYRWRYQAWVIEERIYQWTKLPDEWWAWVKKPALPNAAVRDADQPHDTQGGIRPRSL